MNRPRATATSNYGWDSLRRMIALTIPQRCSRIIRAVFRTGSRPQSDARSSHRCHPASAQVLLR